MKKFIQQIIKFTYVPLIVFVVGLVLVSYISESVAFKLNQSIREIYIGDSHIQCAIIDSLLTNSKNISTASESFYFSYFKLANVIKKNRQIEKIYLGFSYHSLSSYYDDYICGQYSLSVSPKYFYIVPIEEKFQLALWNAWALNSFVKDVSLIGYEILFDDKKFFSDFGYSNDFSNTEASQTSMTQRLQTQYFTDGSLNNFSEINLFYLKKIIDLCNSKKITLILLNTPLHSFYKSKIPAIYSSKYKELLTLYKLRVIDLQNLSLPDSCFTPDGDHVSKRGAMETSDELRRINNFHKKSN